MVGEKMMGSEENAAEEGFEEFDEWFIRRKIEELLRKALYPPSGYRGLKATHSEVTRELAEIRANYARYGEAYVEYVGRLGEGEEKAFREAEKAMREALEHVDELKIRKTGKATWKAKLPGRRWRLYVRARLSGHWSVEVSLYIKVAKVIVPDTLKLPPVLLRAAQEGWVLGDASYIAGHKRVEMGTAHAWQVASFPGFWPGKEVTVYVRGVVVNETRVSMVWQVRVHGVHNAPRWWRLRKEEKRRIAVAEIEEANKGNIDERRAVRIATYYAADGAYPGSNSAKRFLEFAVGREEHRVRQEQSVKIVRLIYEKAPQLLEYMVASGCKKAMFLASLAFVKPRHYAPRYLEVCGVKMNLQLIKGNCTPVAHLMAQVYITRNNEEMLRDFPERAAREGLEVKKVKLSKYWGYRAGQKSLMKYADRYPHVYDTLIEFVQEELEATPPDHPARRSIERLLERLRKAKEEALKRLGHQDAKT